MFFQKEDVIETHILRLGWSATWANPLFLSYEVDVGRTVTKPYVMLLYIYIYTNDTVLGIRIQYNSIWLCLNLLEISIDILMGDIGS